VAEPVKACRTCGLQRVCTLVKSGRSRAQSIGMNIPGLPQIPLSMLPMPCGGVAWEPMGDAPEVVTRFFEDLAPPRTPDADDTEPLDIEWNERNLPV